jgi:hypothetical protein
MRLESTFVVPYKRCNIIDVDNLHCFFVVLVDSGDGKFSPESVPQPYQIMSYLSEGFTLLQRLPIKTVSPSSAQSPSTCTGKSCALVSSGPLS